MRSQRALESYHHVAVETADQKSLILVCYDEAIRSLQIGKSCYLRRELEEKGRQFVRAQDFISELMSSLNMEAGGQIARNLGAIYAFCIQHITLANLDGNMKSVDEVLSILSELRSAWAQIGAKPATADITSQPPQPTMRLTGVAV